MKRLILLACSLTACSNETPSTSEPATVVSLTFDDTRADQYQVGALVAARQMRATFYVNSPRIGRDGYMTLEQLRTLESEGNEIAGHTLAHVHLAELDSDAARRDICDDRLALVDLGFKVTTFAYPFGNQSPAIRRMVEMCGYNAGRDSAGLAFASRCEGCPVVNTMVPDDPYLVRSVGPITSDVTLEQLQEPVLAAEQAGGGWVPIVFHRVCDGCSTNAVRPALLAEFLDWLATRQAHGVGVRTVQDVIGGPVRAALAGPPPGAVANLTPNPSLELDEDRNDTPDCWHTRSSGTNEATFSRSDAAYEGSVAQQITITSYTDGARRLLTRPECPLPAAPGHRYRISGWYSADTPPRYGIYYRDTSGAWMSLEQSPPLAVSQTYTQAVHTTIPLPADATALSVGLGINAVGSITMDAFNVVDASAPIDNAPPEVALIRPVDGSAVASTVMVTATASDPDGIAHVDFRVDDLLEEWDESDSFAIPWNTSGLGRGTYVLTARAFDRAGNVATSAPVTVTVGVTP